MRVPRAFLALALILASPATAASQPSPKDDGVWTTVTVAARPIGAPRQAPADEYFGPERLSNLGVRNAIRDMNLEGTSPLALPIQLERIKAVEDALAIWSDRYPHDSWLPGSTLDFAKFLQSKDQPYTDDLALGYLYFLVARYPATSAGFEARRLLDGYHALPAFDMSAAGSQDAAVTVGAYTFAKIRK